VCERERDRERERERESHKHKHTKRVWADARSASRLTHVFLFFAVGRPGVCAGARSASRGTPQTVCLSFQSPT
jgi:hypothetical protein